MGKKPSRKLPEDYPLPTCEQVREIVEYNPMLHRDGFDEYPYMEMPVEYRLLAMRASREYLFTSVYEEVCASLIFFKRFGVCKAIVGEGIHQRSLMAIYPVMAKDDNLTPSHICPGAIVIAAEYVGSRWRVNVDTLQFEFAFSARWYCDWEHWYVTRGLMEYTRPRFYKRHRNEFY